MKLTQILVWLAVSSAVLSLGIIYLRRRLVRDTALPAPWPRRASALLWTLWGCQVAAFALGRVLPRDPFVAFNFVALSCMGLLATVVSLLIILDATRLLVRGTLALKRRLQRRPVAPVDSERRLLLGRWIAGVATLGGAGLTAMGEVEALSRFRIAEVEVFLDKLPAEFDGFTIAQISDIHIGPTIGHDFIVRMVEAVNSLSPDLIAITGDLVDGSVANLSHHAAPLAGLHAPHGRWFVTGNHEYYSGADEWVDELARLGIPTLRNRRVSIERDGAAFDLAGVTDYRAASHGDAPDLAWALRHRDPSRELVLLAHQPAAVKEAEQHGVGLQLSGHTHGGQFWPFSWLVYLAQPIVRGLGRFGATQIYVSTGTGYWGPPVRTGTSPEITRVKLRAKAHRRVA